MSVLINVFNSSGKQPLPNKKLADVVRIVLKKEKIKKAKINIVLVDNDELRKLNKKFLNHNYNTDVISFDISEEFLEGEIYISVDKAIEQTDEYKVSLTKELMRLAIHGALHLAGYDDSTNNERNKMTALENAYLS
ncbi:MAG: rRNA maturation RNase YbeY [Bacteroidota bacterium]